MQRLPVPADPSETVDARIEAVKARLAQIAPAGVSRPPRMRRWTPPRPTLLQVSQRCRVWAGMVLRFLAGELWDRVRQRSSPHRSGQRAARLLEGAGPIAVKVGIEFASRIDLIPLETSLQLSRMSELVPSFDFVQARSRMEDAMGGKLEEVFVDFDPQPLRSTIVQSTWRGRLKDGSEVALRVRRPGVGQALMAELVAMDAVTTVLEWTSALSPEFFDHLRQELRLVIEDELDFISVARAQRLFRQRARKLYLRKVTATRVLMKYQREDVKVSDFVSGVNLDRLGRRPSAGSLVKMAEFPPSLRRKIARNLLDVCWWGLFEAPFFQSDPTAAAIIARPDGRLVFTGLDRCEVATGKRRRALQDAYRALMVDDVSDAAAAMVRVIEPLPPIDVEEFKMRLASRLWLHLCSMRNLDRPFPERDSTGLWVALLEVAREFSVPVRLDALRLMQSTLNHERIAGRVYPRIDLLREFERYLQRADSRMARRGLAELQDSEARLGEGLGDRALFDRTLDFFDDTFEDLPVQMTPMSKKAAFVTNEVIRTTLALGLVLLFGLAGLGINEWAAGRRVSLIDLLPELGGHSAFLIICIFILLRTIRVLIMRLQDRDD